MPKKLFLHIGSPKTASSTIQKFLFDNRNKLKEAGVLYPEPPLQSHRIDPRAHLDMVEFYANANSFTFDWRRNQKFYFDTLLSQDCDVNILSAEPFFFENPNNLSDFFSAFSTKIICFLRNYFDFCSSRQKQMIKTGCRKDLFALYYADNHYLFGRVDDYVRLLGLENCFFYNFDKIRHLNIVDIFLKRIESSLKLCGTFSPVENTTPSDAATMFMYQLSFLPFNSFEWNFLRNDIVRLDLNLWNFFHASFLPSVFFTLDQYSKSAIRRQGELLQDPDWYDYTMSRGEDLAAIENHELPPEIQHDIWEKLSDEARTIILRYWPKAGQAPMHEPLLPSLEKIAPDIFEQMMVLRYGYTVSIGNALCLQEQLLVSVAARTALEENVHMGQQSSVYRRAVAARHSEPDTFFNRLRACLAPLVSPSARQAYDIRRSGLFDTGWYLEQYPDVAEAGIDPIVHYVRFGAKEGRDPASWFSTTAYTKAYPDVAASRLNPLYHYIRYGIVEGRCVHQGNL